MTGPFTARNLLGLLALCLLAVGCQRKSQPASSPKSEQSEVAAITPLRLIVVDDSILATAIQREWAAQGRESLDVEVIDPTADLAMRGQSADILIFPPCQLGDLVEANVIRPLPKELAPGANSSGTEPDDYRWGDIFPVTRREELRWGALIYGVPFGSPQLVLQIRRDQFPESTFQTPQTWQEYSTLLTQRKASIAGDGKSELLFEAVAAEPLGTGWAARMLLVRSAAYVRHRSQYSALFQFATMEPLINQPPFVRALQDLLDVSDCFPADILELTPQDVSQRLRTGKVTVAISWPSASRDAEREAAGPESILLAELPGSTEVYHLPSGQWQTRSSEESPHVPTLAVDGRMGSVTTASRQVARASELLLWLTAPEQSVRVASGSPHTTLFRRSQLAQPELWFDSAWAGVASEYAEILETTQQRSTWLMTPRIPAQSDYLETLDRAVRRAMQERADPQQVLNEVATAWSEITRQHDPKRQRQAYLKSLGL
jgi:multiple sugar transport system substrate-binding protein